MGWNTGRALSLWQTEPATYFVGKWKGKASSADGRGTFHTTRTPTWGAFRAAGREATNRPSTALSASRLREGTPRSFSRSPTNPPKGSGTRAQPRRARGCCQLAATLPTPVLGLETEGAPLDPHGSAETLKRSLQ